MNILITGGFGFIGSVLIKELLKDPNNKVTVLDNLSFRQTGSIFECGHKNLSVEIGDVRDASLLRSLVIKNDLIIPLAAIVGEPACKKYKKDAADINYRQIEDIYEILSNNQKLICPCTNSQYGQSATIITEDSPFKPLGLYAQTKCMAEKIILDKGNGVSFRLATVFGVSPRLRLDLLVNDFCYKAYTDGYLILFESHFRRNYVHVKDVCKAFIFAINNYDKMNGQAYNVGLSTANITKKELAIKIKEYIPDLVIKEDEFKKDIDKRDYIVSSAKLEALGWYPSYTLDDGIQEILKACKIIKPNLDRNYNNI